MINQEKKTIGLALSGGGYRAAAYHLGTLKALNRLGILSAIDVISSVSGGSITAAYYALNKSNFEEFEKSFILKLQKGVLYSSLINFFIVILLSGSIVWYIGWWSLLPQFLILFVLWYKIFPFSYWVIREYDRVFFKHKSLSDLPSRPLLAINSTDVSTGTLFTFSQQKMAGYQYEGVEKRIVFKHEKFPLSKAVMASSCVPFAFSPIIINKKYYNVPFKKGTNKPLLIDGGLYDNQGAHKLTEKQSIYYTSIVIVSDAGVDEMNSKWAFNIPLMLVKTSNIMMRRIKTFQIRNNIYSNNNNEINFAYLSLMWDISDRPILGFIQNIMENHISNNLIELHKLNMSDLSDLYDSNNHVRSNAKQKIIEQLKENIDWLYLETLKPTEEEHALAKNIGTNLTALRKKEIEALIKHSNWLTEVQVRLYLPDIISKQNKTSP